MAEGTEACLEMTNTIFTHIPLTRIIYKTKAYLKERVAKVVFFFFLFFWLPRKRKLAEQHLASLYHNTDLTRSSKIWLHSTYFLPILSSPPQKITLINFPLFPLSPTSFKLERLKFSSLSSTTSKLFFHLLLIKFIHLLNFRKDIYT